MKTLFIIMLAIISGCNSRTDMGYAQDISNCQILALSAIEFHEASDKDEQIYSIITHVEKNYPDDIAFDVWIPNHNADDLILFSKSGRYMNGKPYTIKVYQNGDWKILAGGDFKAR